MITNILEYKLHIERIKKEGDEFVVYPKKGGKRLGTHSTKKKALKQLAAIEISKAKYNEALINSDDSYDIYEIKCKDIEGQLKSLIEYIKENGNTGHGFSIIVDPKDENEKEFYWDGDGGDMIKEIKVIQERKK